MRLLFDASFLLYCVSLGTFIGNFNRSGDGLVPFQNSADIQAIIEPGTCYSIVSPSLQLSHEVLSIPEPGYNSSVTDPIAMQLMTEFEVYDEKQEHLKGHPSCIEDSISDNQIPTCSKSTNEGVTAVPDDIPNENQTSNTQTKHDQEPGYQMCRKKQATNFLKFRSFEVNWDKISDSILERLKKLQEFRLENPNMPVPRLVRFRKTEMSCLVNNVIDQMRCIDTYISADIMESVAKQMMMKYPCLEILDDDGFSNGLSHITIKHKLINRNTYLNRLNNEVHQTIPEAKNRRAGTNKEYWKLITNQCNKEVLSKLLRDEPALLTEEFLLESQGFVRSRLDQKKDLSLIISEFTVIRRRQLLSYHFKQATGINIEMMRKYYVAKKAKIIEYSTTQRGDKLCDTCSDDDVFNFLAKLVEENLDELILKKEIGTRIDDIKDPTTGPVLIRIDIGNGANMYYVYADHTRLSEGSKDIVSAIQDLMCVHYVHSFSAAKFLELVQQYFLKIFPTKGSKSNAVRIGKQQ